MKNFLIFIFLNLSVFTASSQGFVPKSLKIDFSNPKAPEYKKRFKEYKDSIKTLSKLNKKTLRHAVKEFNQLPKAQNGKTNLKNLESDFREYQSLIKEVDSLKDFHENIERIREREDFHLKDRENVKDQNTPQQRKEIASLADEHFGSYENYVLAKQKAGEIESLLDEAKGYTQSIEALIQGNETDKVTSALQARAMKIDAMRETSKQLRTFESDQQALKEQIEEMREKADLKNQFDEYAKDQTQNDLMKKTMSKSSQKLSGLVSKHFEGHEEELAKAQKGLNEYKKGIFNFKKSNKFETIKNNSLKGKPLGERLVIGGYLQINRNEDYSAIDISPQLGYKWTKHYLWGIGGTYRFRINESNLSLIRDQEIYGGRFFMEYSLGKFFAHGEYEMMSHPKADPKTDIVRRINSPGALAGLGINYNFIKHVKGNMMVLYNFLYDRHTSPYQHPIVFRFGFSFGK